MLQPIKIDGKVQTPFGWFSVNHAKMLTEKQVIKWDSLSGGWTYQRTLIKITKDKRNARGQLEEEVLEVTLPIRAYNFEFYLKKLGSIDEALAKVTSDYLPALYDVKNYARLMESVKDKYAEQLAWDELDQKAKAQAFEQIDNFKKNFRTT